MLNNNIEEEKKKKGFVLFWRSFIEWEWFTDVNTCHLFQYCILRANHSDTEWRGQKIKRGSFITSLESLSIATGLSKMQVRTALKKLKKTNEITHQITRQNSIITVNNYDLFQDNNTQITHEITSKQHQNNIEITTDKELKRMINNEVNKITNNNNKENFKNFNDDDISDLDANRIKDLSNYYGEYKNVHLTSKQYDDLKTLIMNDKALNEVINNLSENIETGKESIFDYKRPSMHFIRLKKYWQFRINKQADRKSVV